MKKLISLLAVFASLTMWSQTQVSGTVSDADGQPLPGANIVLDGSTGAVSDFDGNFTLSTDQQPPFTITVSSVGFESTSVEFTSASGSLAIQLSEGSTQLDEIVVSASRFAQRIFESPVTVEKFNVQQIAATPAADYFSGLEEIRGIQVNKGGLVFSQVNTRGFGTLYNEGFVTLVDGMDNQAPIFGFAIGNLIGLNELDVQSIEVLPGAASALYGADAYKGIMFMNSKSPFDDTGVSAYVKSGITSQDVSGQNEFTDVGIRIAHAFSDKFAIKATYSNIEGTDWEAADTRPIDADGRIVDGVNPLDPTYNGVNVYGDELGQSVDFTDAFAGNVIPADYAALAPLFAGDDATYTDFFGPTQLINFSGYDEKDLTDGETSNYKYNVEAAYRPSDNLEITLGTRQGGGKIILQGLSRYTIDDFKMTQNKLEVNWGKLNVKAYTTEEDAGGSYDTNAAGLLMFLSQPDASGNFPHAANDAFVGVTNWYTMYVGGFFTAMNEANPALVPTILGAAATGALSDANGDGAVNIYDMGVSSLMPFHNAGRTYANTNLHQPGDGVYETVLDGIKSGAAKLTDNTKTQSFELNYDLTDRIDFADILVGGSFRNTDLNTQGTVLTDYDGSISYYQYGMYTQAKKDLGKLTLTGSVRYDKSEFFDAVFTPRLGALYSISDNQNLRVSFQTGFRNPTNQDQYIGLRGSRTVLMGSSPDSVDRFNMPFQRASDGAVYNVTGDIVFATALNPMTYQSQEMKNVEPEYIVSYDIGYRFNTPTTSFDIAAYLSQYDNFIATQDVWIPLLYNGQTVAQALGNQDVFPFSVDGNVDEEISSYGVSVAVNQALTQKIGMNMSYEFNDLDYTPSSATSLFEPAFNTPEHRFKVSVVGKNIKDFIGFNVGLRSNSEYDYQASFIDETIKANTVIDAQISFNLKNSINSVIKVGGTNIGGDDYVSLVGSGMIGQMTYVSLTFNP
ncbi:MAG: TonB-dependent receptor [Flavobacteriaceae bacterium]|nr:TonB-dependent receptor [Flavobacteriaceae bacterium]